MREPAGIRILVWMCVLIAVNQLGFGSIIPALALYARSFDVTQSAIGLAIAIYGLARFLVAVPAGQLADRLGRRSTLAMGGLLSAFGNLLCALAPNYPAFVGARFVAGAGAALVLTTGLIVIADISTPSNRGRMMSAYQGVFIFAVGIGPLPGGLLATHWGLAPPSWPTRSRPSWPPRSPGSRFPRRGRRGAPTSPRPPRSPTGPSSACSPPIAASCW
jgi:MFS transporter, DHA1 family, multidrug resistance protein